MQKQTGARSEFSAALHQVASERNLNPDVVVDAIKQAILAAFKKDHPESYSEEEVYDVSLDSGTGEARIHDSKKVDITPPGFGRIAAMTAKQVILQKVREAEKSNVIGECEKRLGTLVSGTIIRVIGGEVVVEIDAGKLGRIEAVMPREQQVFTEDYRLNQRLTFLMHSIRDSLRGREVVVSRADPNLIKELFRREVPEVNSGAVEVRAIARDPGSRTKIAVYSNQSGIDPVGSCVGQKGVRVQAVISEINGEKIDIIQYSDDLEKFVASALAPATGLTVKINAAKEVAEVTAPADQLSLAIGREGQNAKLAGRLVGLHIDIKGTSERKEDTVSDDDKPQPVNDQ